MATQVGGYTTHGTRKVAVHLNADRQRKFEELTRFLSPVRPALIPITEVLLYCIDQTWEACCGEKGRATDGGPTG